MDTVRAVEHHSLATVKADHEQGISGVQDALGTQRNCNEASQFQTVTLLVFIVL